jgi:23S rRNA-/tRNA-specific pseudouridylate synthase
MHALQCAVAVRRCCILRGIATKAAQPSNEPLRLLCRHDDLVVFDKPAGMMVHPHAHVHGHCAAGDVVRRRC